MDYMNRLNDRKMISEKKLKERQRRQWMFEIKVKSIFWLVLLLILSSLVLAAFEVRALRRGLEGVPKLLDEVEQQINWRKL